MEKIKIWDPAKKCVIGDVLIIYIDGKIQEVQTVTNYDATEGWDGDDITEYEIIHYTGETDDTNQDLWENDIVENHPGDRFVIVQDRSQWYLRDIHGRTNITLHTACSLGIKKIGNFYLNPDLLRGNP